MWYYVALVDVNSTRGAKPQMCHFWLGDVCTQCWAIQHQSHHPRFSQDRCIPAKNPAAKVREGNLNWRVNFFVWFIYALRHIKWIPDSIHFKKSQSLKLSPCRTITRGRSLIGVAKLHTVLCIDPFFLHSICRAHTTHAQNMYLDVYVHVHLVTPSIWMVVHFWGLKRMTSKLPGCNRKEPKIPKEKCNAVVRFKDWHAKTLTQIKRKFQRKFMIHESHDDIKSHQVASSHMLDTLFPVGAPKKVPNAPKLGRSRDVAGKDARSWDEVWDSEAPWPGIQCQTHTARCHCKYVKK